MTCSETQHFWAWVSNSTDSRPPPGSPCLCGAYITPPAPVSDVEVAVRGRCALCGQPVDDHHLLVTVELIGVSDTRFWKCPEPKKPEKEETA